MFTSWCGHSCQPCCGSFGSHNGFSRLPVVINYIHIGIKFNISSKWTFEIPKARQHEWRNEKAKSQFKLKSLEGNQIQGIKLMNGESLEEFMKRNISK
jgi:hypothetical protein